MVLKSFNPASMMTKPEVFTPSKLERAKIAPVDKKGHALRDERGKLELEFQFNPEELSITKEVSWTSGEPTPGRNAPDLDFGGGKPASFSLDLLFDTTQTGDDVRKYTNQLLRLVMLGPESAGYRQAGMYRLPPPPVQFVWGKITLFIAVINKVKLTFTLFLPDGTPVRAKAAVDFIQYDTSDDEKGSTNPTTRTEARKTRRVEGGDRLDLIAYEEYGHPRHWRYLAEVNGLLDPLDLQPGQILVVPPLP